MTSTSDWVPSIKRLPLLGNRPRLPLPPLAPQELSAPSEAGGALSLLQLELLPGSKKGLGQPRRPHFVHSGDEYGEELGGRERRLINETAQGSE